MSEIKKHRFVIIGGDNINSLGVLRSLGEAGLNPEMIMVNERIPSFVLNSRYAKIVHKSSSIEDSLTILCSVYGKDTVKPFVYTTDDNHEQLLDAHFEELKDRFYFFNAGEAGRVTNYMDKKNLCDLAQECGFKVPNSEVVQPGELPQKLSYPVITKTLNPYLPGWKKDVFICYNEAELASAYKTMVSSQLIVQEYVEKKNEMPIHGFSCNKGESVFLAYYSLYYRMGKDTFGFYNYYKPLQDPILAKKIKRMIKEIGFTGCFEIEFLVDRDDNLVFLEINFRPSMKSYACTYGGLNLPLLWAKSTLKYDIDIIKPQMDFFTAMFEPGDYGQNVATKQISYKQWFQELRKVDLTFLYNKKDKKPAIKYWMNVAQEIIRHKIKELFCLSK